MPDRTSTKHLMIEIPSDQFRLLWRAAAELAGIHPSSLAVSLILRGLKQIEEMKDDPEMRLFALAQDVVQERESERILIGIAKHLSAFPSENYADRFIELCEELGYSPEDIIAQGQKEVATTQLLLDRGITKASKAEDFLATRMEPGKRYPARKMIALAAIEDLTEGNLKAARKRLGITSTRVGGKINGYVWEIPVLPDMKKFKRELRELQESDTQFAVAPVVKVDKDGN